MQTIHKVAAVVIENNKFLMVRKKGKDIWTSLGGRIEQGETEEECLLREVKEEFDCAARIVRKIGDFEDKAVFDDAHLILSCYLVELDGSVRIADDELEEYMFVGKNYSDRGIKLSPTIEKQIIPYCITEGILRW